MEKTMELREGEGGALYLLAGEKCYEVTDLQDTAGFVSDVMALAEGDTAQWTAEEAGGVNEIRDTSTLVAEAVLGGPRMLSEIRLYVSAMGVSSMKYCGIIRTSQ